MAKGGGSRTATASRSPARTAGGTTRSKVASARGRAAPQVRRFRVVPLLFTLLGLAILIGLGTWQLQRLAWKERLLAEIAALRTAPAEPLSVVLNRIADGRDVDFTRVQTLCPSLEQTPTLKLYALREAEIGYRLITACPLDRPPYRSVLVDRGFVAREDVGKVAAAASLSAGPVIGVLRHGDKPGWFTPKHASPGADWYGRDIPAMAAALNAPAPAPIFLMLESPKPRGFGPAPAPVPAEISNRHLGYAITWYGLAAALAGVYIASLIRRSGKV